MTEYLLIEKGGRGPDARDKALDKHGAKIKYATSLSETGPGGTAGIILSNELVDALPSIG
jgi:SAM-dependent MidA family methyltransferase